MFVFVVHRVFQGRGERASAVVAWIVGALAVSWAAVRTRRLEKPEPVLRSLALAAAVTAAGFVSVKIILWVLPNGLIWGPKAALAATLWIGLLGASCATYEKRHLALEMTDKIWPAKLAPWVRGLANLCAA